MAFVFMSPVCQIVRQCNILTFLDAHLLMIEITVAGRW